MDVAVKRYQAFHDGDASDIYCIRDGEKLTLEEVMSDLGKDNNNE